MIPREAILGAGPPLTSDTPRVRSTRLQAVDPRPPPRERDPRDGGAARLQGVEETSQEAIPHRTSDSERRGTTASGAAGRRRRQRTRIRSPLTWDMAEIVSHQPPIRRQGRDQIDGSRTESQVIHDECLEEIRSTRKTTLRSPSGWRTPEQTATSDGCSDRCRIASCMAFSMSASID